MVGRRILKRVGSVSEPSRDVRVFHFGFACMLQLVTVEDYNWRCKCVSAVSFQNIQYICSANYYSVNRHFIGQKCSTLRISIQFQRLFLELYRKWGGRILSSQQNVLSSAHFICLRRI